MKVQDLADDFFDVIKRNFPMVQIKSVPTRPNPRFSLYVPNSKRNKRWMQVELHRESLQVAMDHKRGEISKVDVESIQMHYGRGERRTAITIVRNDDAVNFSVFADDPYNFYQIEFVTFLKKHYASYLRRVEVHM